MRPTGGDGHHVGCGRGRVGLPVPIPAPPDHGSIRPQREAVVAPRRHRHNVGCVPGHLRLSIHVFAPGRDGAIRPQRQAVKRAGGDRTGGRLAGGNQAGPSIARLAPLSDAADPAGVRCDRYLEGTAVGPPERIGRLERIISRMRGCRVGDHQKPVGGAGDRGAVAVPLKRHGMLPLHRQRKDQRIGRRRGDGGPVAAKVRRSVSPHGQVEFIPG
ncbi:MAG: hypothetical protein BWX84_01248 [Verrucomicrobia bacterium ADurb.Bin118]|nr:MAG: hypothetical protein BWX84_01248 [Verrucomicrobia bacterium ADurb.Bin118]